MSGLMGVHYMVVYVVGVIVIVVIVVDVRWW